MAHFTFLNNTNSWAFFVVFSVFLFFSSGLGVLLSFILALIIVNALRNIKPFNQQQPVPSSRALVITGCSTGIGLDSALHFSKQGFTVFATVRTQKHIDKLNESSNGNLIPLLMDVNDFDSITKGFEFIKAEVEKKKLLLHGLVLNAGYAEAGPLELQPLKRIQAQLQTNVIGQIACVQTFLPLLRKTSSVNTDPGLAPRILWISSGVGELSIPGASIYSASKHAVQALAHGLHLELLHWNIHSISIQPGAIKTEFGATAQNTGSEALLEGSSKEGVDPSVINHYKQAQEKARNRPRNYSSTQVVIDAITSALLDSNPLSDYRAGNDVQIGLLLNRYFPSNGLVQLIAGKTYA